MVVEAVGGWLSGSLALLADAGHMLTDVGALGLTLLTAWIARRPADQRKTYGYLRWEILAALVNGALLFGIAGLVVFEALRRIDSPVPIRGGLFLGVAIAGLLVNGVSLYLLHGAHRHHMNTRGALPAHSGRPAGFGGRGARRRESSCSPDGCPPIR